MSSNDQYGRRGRGRLDIAASQLRIESREPKMHGRDDDELKSRTRCANAKPSQPGVASRPGKMRVLRQIFVPAPFNRLVSTRSVVSNVALEIATDEIGICGT